MGLVGNESWYLLACYPHLMLVDGAMCIPSADFTFGVDFVLSCLCITNPFSLVTSKIKISSVLLLSHFLSLETISSM